MSDREKLADRIGLNCIHSSPNCTCDFCQAAAALRTPAPGKIIGMHWIEAAVDRIIAGESEAAVFADYGYVRQPKVTDAEVEEIRRMGDWIERLLSLAESAWGVIANAHGGDWDRAKNPDWKPAAERWRDEWHKALKGAE